VQWREVSDPKQRREILRQVATRQGNQAVLRLLQRKPEEGAQDTSQSDQVNQQALNHLDDATRVQMQLDRGRPLDSHVRQEMEAGIGQPLGEVEIHTGELASHLASEQEARAFTVGRHVVFGAGQYQPGTLEGDAILAHELAHVVQQRGASPGKIEGNGSQGGLEHDADQAVVGMARQRFGSIPQALSGFTQLAGARMRSGLRISKCISASKGKTEEERYEAVKDALSKAETGFKAAHYAIPDKEASEKALAVSEGFGKINSAIGKFDAAVEIYDFVDSYNDFSRYNPQDNPQEFALAAGRFLASAGTIMKRSSIPGISMYGEFLSQAGGFFEGMRRKLDPAERYKDREDWKEAMKY